jgi:hypothetical protein
MSTDAVTAVIELGGIRLGATDKKKTTFYHNYIYTVFKFSSIIRPPDAPSSIVACSYRYRSSFCVCFRVMPALNLILIN